MSPSGIKAKEARAMDIIAKIDAQVKGKTQGRIRLIKVIGDYIYKGADERQIKRRAEELGVTVGDLLVWFYID
jgi:hypothetical protein